MLALSISDVKGFMTKLLKGETFDNFVLKNVFINSFVRFEIYGISDGECVKWNAVRPHVLSIIKGDEPPKSIKIVLGKEAEEAGLRDVALSFNIHFEDGKVSITTGISKKNFSLDKSDDEKWDAAVLNFLDDSNIKYVSGL